MVKFGKRKMPVVNVGLTFILSAAILLIGFAGNSLFKRTGLPDVLFLIILGLMFGPILNLFPKESLQQISPFLTTLTFIMVLFNGGLEMDLSKVFANSGRALVLALTYFILATMGVSVFARFALGLSWFSSLLFGPMIAGTSSVVIIPLASKLKLGDDVTITLSIESVITDALNVVFLFALIDARVGGFLDLGEVGSILIQKFSIGMVLGAVLGVVWLRVLHKVRQEEFVYIATLSILLIAFEGSELVGGSGVLSVLIFGIVLSNEKRIHSFLGVRMGVDLDEVKSSIVKFQGELSFLMRTFFFFFLGLIYTLGVFSLWQSLLYAVTIVGLNLGLRYVAVSFSTIRSEMKKDHLTMTLLCGQGLAHAALSLVPSQLDLPNSTVYITIVTNVIILTNIITSLSAFFLKRPI